MTLFVESLNSLRLQDFELQAKEEGRFDMHGLFACIGFRKTVLIFIIIIFFLVMLQGPLLGPPRVFISSKRAAT